LIARPQWAAEPQLSVFVNCPYDAAFRTSLDAIVLTCVHAGFLPWMAGSTGSTAVPRVERILEGLMWCRYSIHDLTRYQGEGPDNLSRFNMPLELGMAMALRGLRPEAGSHDWTVMVPEGHVYQQYISDLAGFDPMVHDGSQRRVALAVLAWLMTRPDVPVVVGPADVLPKLPEYSARKLALDESWEAKTPWKHVLDLASEVAGR
jgi:hypothetical protein